jgi:uncharacterized protein (TIGR02231 family)
MIMAHVPSRVKAVSGYMREIRYIGRQNMAASKVTRVQIYRNSALVTRRGTVSLNAGTNTVYITGLTETTDLNSIRLLLSGNVVTADINYVSAASVSEEERGATREVEKKIATVDFKLQTLKEMMALRKSNANFQNRKDISVEAQERCMTELPGQLLALYGKINDLEEEKRLLGEELAKHQAAERENVIKAELIAETAGEYAFEVRYVEFSANWFPLYEVRYNTDKEPLCIIMKARINQGTREDWAGVSTLLYTGNPSVSNDLPKVRRKELGIMENIRVPRLAAARGKMSVNMLEDAECGAAPDEVCEEAMVYSACMPQATVESSETMTVFELPGTKDILHGSEGNMAELSRFEIPAEYRLLTVPSVNDKAYLSAVVKTEDWPFPAANAKIYVRDAFAGEVFVDPETDENEFELSLGADERINISRKESPVKISDVLLRGQKKKQCEYKIRLRNTSDNELKVLVKDSVPVSTDKSIDVDITELSNGEREEETGIIKWNITAKPGEAEELKVAYTVCWPKGKKLNERTRI